MLLLLLPFFIMLSNEVISTEVFRMDKTSVKLEYGSPEVFKEGSRVPRRGGREKPTDLNKWHQKRESIYHAILLTTQTNDN